MPNYCGSSHVRDRRDSRPARSVLRLALPTHEEIAQLAYSYWEARGRRDGAAVEDWLRAERDLRERRGSQIYW